MDTGEKPQSLPLSSGKKTYERGANRISVVVGLKGFKTVQKLQDKILENNQKHKQYGKGCIENIPALFAVPQFSFQGIRNRKHIWGYSANKLNKNEFKKFEEILHDNTLQNRYHKLDLNQKLQFALDLVVGVKILRDMSFIHADINDQNLFISFTTGHLILIDYDSGAVTENPTESPTTWGKYNGWVAPEIAKQRSNNNQGVPKIKVDLFTDTYSVAVGIHYLIFLKHPFFYLNRMGANDMQDYFRNHRWPDANKSHLNFNKSPAVVYDYDKIKDILINDPVLGEIRKRFEITFNEGYNDPSNRTPYGQWVSTINGAIGHQVKNQSTSPYIPFVVALPQQSTPKLETNKTRFLFPNIRKGSIVSDSFTVSNVGGGVLSGLIKTNKMWLKVSENNIDTTKYKQNIAFHVYTSGLAFGFKDTGIIEIQSNGGAERVNVTLSIEPSSKRRNKFIAAGVGISVLIFIIVPIIVSNVGRKNDKHAQFTVSKLNLEEIKKDEEFPSEYKPSFSVTIDSSPSGATAFIDNKQVGITPLSITLEKGSHGIYFKKEGYKFPGEILEVGKGVNPSIYKLKEE